MRFFRKSTKKSISDEETKRDISAKFSEARAFAIVALSTIKEERVSEATEFVFGELMQLHGGIIDVATNQNCYIEALALFWIFFSVLWRRVFSGIIVVPDQKHVDSLLAYNIGYSSFRKILQEAIKLSVVTIDESDPFYRQILSSSKILPPDRVRYLKKVLCYYGLGKVIIITDDDLDDLKRFISYGESIPPKILSSLLVVRFVRFGDIVRSSKSLFEV
jgi:hypothetical protein